MSLIGERSNPASQVSRIIPVFNGVTAAFASGTYVISNGGDTGATAAPTNLIVCPFQWVQIMINNSSGALTGALQVNLNRAAPQNNTLFQFTLTAAGTAGANGAAILPVDSQGLDLVLSVAAGAPNLDCTIIGIDNPTTEYTRKVQSGQQSFIDCARMELGGQSIGGGVIT
jgi:hypothetical protein